MELDIAPDFGAHYIGKHIFAVGAPVALTLPVATGGTGAINYTLYTSRGQVMEGESILGLTWNVAARTLTGTATSGMRSFRLDATDSDINNAADDTARLLFSIRVVAAGRASPRILAARSYTTGTSTSDRRLP